MQHQPNYHKLVFTLIALLAAFSIATPALADYLGPDRTVTQTVGVCQIVLLECKLIDGQYKDKRVEDWSCSNESKPWDAYPSHATCKSSGDVGNKHWERDEKTETITITHPPATISGSIQNCALQNGWCVGTAPQLSLYAAEPLAGQRILLIEGTLNEVSFACQDEATSCEITLIEGENNFTYWALSSWGDSSAMGTSSARVDTVAPNVSLDVTGVRGANDWYVSPITVTAIGWDAVSGVASALLSADQFTWQPSITLTEGVHQIAAEVKDNAGNVSQSSATLSVDTTTPAISLSVNGTAGNNGWYRSVIQVSALFMDVNSGIATFEASSDGAAYQTYTGPISFNDGYHTIQFRAVDRAGNRTETPVQEFYVDTHAPEVDLPGSWQLGQNVPYSVQDKGSGLATLRIVIEDEDERYPKVAWNEDVSGATYSQDIDWNGQFKDKTIAPPGTYLVWIKATDKAGNEHFELGRVIVPETNMLLSLLPTEEPSMSVPVPPAELSESNAGSSPTLPQDLGFGGEITEPTEVTTSSLLLSTGTAGGGGVAGSSSGILWGAAAAAAIGAATAYTLEATRKRKEAEAEQAARVKADIARDEQERAEKKQKQQENWNKQQAYEEALRQERLEAIREQNEDRRTERNDKLVDEQTKAFSAPAQDWKPAYDAYMYKKAQEKKAEELSKLSKLTDYNNSEKQDDGDVVIVPPGKAWWQKTLDWVDQHQTEIAVGFGIVVGVAAIILSGGLAAPAVAAAWTLGAAAVAAGTIAVGTVALNTYYGREWHENLLKNVANAGIAAGLITGGWFIVQTGIPAAATYCTSRPAMCAIVEPALKAWDAGEEIWLTAKLTYQTWKGDEKGAAETAFELHSEYVDGGMPGNAVAKELIDKYADMGQVVGKYGEDAIDLIKRYGGPAVQMMRAVDPKDAKKLLETLDLDTVIHVADEGPEALAALARWDADDLREHGVELALRAKKDAKVLSSIKELISSGSIDPKHLTEEQQALISEIAANSTQYADEGQVVIGKWVDYSGGFLEYARDTASVHYSPHPDMWKLLGDFGKESQEDVAWLINRQVVQTGIDKGLPFEYTLNDIPAENIINEGNAVEAIFAGATESEIMDILQVDYMPIRMKELQELQSAGYEFAFDEAANSYIFIMP